MKKKITLVWRITQDQNGLFRYQFGIKGERLENSPGHHSWDDARQLVQNEIEQQIDQYDPEYEIDVEELVSPT